MLVLSRRPNETIRFPQLGISVSIVSVKGNRVQVGVDAPAEIQVLRKELESVSVPTLSSGGIPSRYNANVGPLQGLSEKERHDFKNRLSRATLGLHLAQKQLAAGQTEAANKTLSTALDRLRELDQAALSSSTYETAPPRPKAFVSQTRRKCEPMVCDNELKSDCIDVLLVEDDQNEQVLLRTLLEMEGYRVHTANNGLEAIKCLEYLTPRCVLLDMMMPECDGPETLERMRAIPSMSELPIFAVSATSPESIGLSIGTDGIDDWFPKPLNAPRLVKHMRNRIASLCT